MDYFTNQGKGIHLNLITDDSKSACILERDAIKYLDARTKGKFKYTMLSERVMSDLNGFAFQKNHFVSDEFNRRIVQLLESGVIDGIFKMYNSIYHVHEWKDDDEGPTVLTFDRLEFWFQVWFYCLIASVLSFVFEHLANKLTFELSLKQMFVHMIDFCHKRIRKQKLKYLKSKIKKSTTVRKKKKSRKLTNKVANKRAFLNKINSSKT